VTEHANRIHCGCALEVVLERPQCRVAGSADVMSSMSGLASLKRPSPSILAASCRAAA
jgi:hypothetical protein